MSFEVAVIKEFAAAHKLEKYEGNCSRVHGHTWKVELVVVGEELDNVGMHIDFRLLKSVLGEIIDTYDHTFLNEVEPFNTLNPTAENLAKVIYDKAKCRLSKYKIKMVKVWESQSTYVIYKED